MRFKESQPCPTRTEIDAQEAQWRHAARHYSPEFQDAYVHYQLTGDRAVLGVLAAGLLEFHVEHISREFIEERGESLNLKTDLGADSIALAEVAFAVEGLFGIHMTNEDLIGLETLHDLGDFIERRRAR